MKHHVLHWDGGAAVLTTSTRSGCASADNRAFRGGSERGEPRLGVIFAAIVADTGGRLLEDRPLIIGQFADGLTDAQDEDAVAAELGACRRVLLDHDAVLAGVVSVETFDCGDQPKRTYRGDCFRSVKARELWGDGLSMRGARLCARRPPQGDGVRRLRWILSEWIEQ